MSALFPVFIPHLGCPHQCVFCDQHTIAAPGRFDPAIAEEELTAMLAGRAPGLGGEIAFFGGSFTGIDLELMCRLLSFAKGFADRGIVSGIRLSTRPDYITPEILATLRRYPVTTVELGIQSLSDHVLRACERGHTAAQSIEACRAVKEAGFTLVGQMMTGLPASTRADEVETAQALCDLGIAAARIYPTVVFPGTPLAEMAARGDYAPPTLADTVARCADVFTVFLSHAVPVIRIGLCSTEAVRTSGVGFHDSVGALIRSEVYRRRIEQALASLPVLPKAVTVLVAKGHTSLAVGHKRTNKASLEERFGVRLKIKEDENRMPFVPKILPYD